MGHKQGVNRRNPYAYEGEYLAQRFFGAEDIGQDTGHRNDGRLKSGVLFEVKTTPLNRRDFWGGEYYSHLKHDEDFILLVQKVDIDGNRNLKKVNNAEAYYVDHNIWKQHFKKEASDYFFKLKEEWETNNWHPDPDGIYDSKWKECQKYMKDNWSTDHVKICLKKEHHGNQFRLQCNIKKSILDQFVKLEEIDGKRINEYIGSTI